MQYMVKHRGIVYNYVAEIIHNIFSYTLMYLETIIFKLNLNYIYSLEIGPASLLHT